MSLCIYLGASLAIGMFSPLESISSVPKLISYYAFSVLNVLNLRSIQWGDSTVELGQYVYSDPGAEVVDGIFIGSLATATEKTWIGNNNIGVIINLSGTTYDAPVPVMSINMADAYVDCDHMSDYLQKFDSGVSTIRDARARGQRVLVHCAAGINRSATLIGLYLIESGMDYARVIHLLTDANNRRSVPTLTNSSFRYILCARDAFNRAFDKKLS